MFGVRGSGGSSNGEETPAEWTWTVDDTTGPDTTLDVGPAGRDRRPRPFSFSSNDQPGDVRVLARRRRLHVLRPGPSVQRPLTQGEHTFRVRAVDAAGNTDQSPATREWRVETRPETTIDIGPEAESTGDDRGFGFSSNEPGSTFECSLDAGAVRACASPQRYTAWPTASTPVASGRPTPTATRRDAGGVGLDGRHVRRRRRSSPAGRPGRPRRAAFRFSSSEPGVTFECSLDGGGVRRVRVAVPAGRRSQGSTPSRSVRSTAPATSTRRRRRTPGPTTTAPQTTIDSAGRDQPRAPRRASRSPPTRPARRSSARSTAAVRGVRLAQAVPGLEPGARSASAPSTSPANVDPTPATATWTVARPRRARVIEPARDRRASTDGDLRVHLRRAAARSSARSTAPRSRPAPAEAATPACQGGEHTFRVRAVDAAGNVEPDAETRTWTVRDTTRAAELDRRRPTAVDRPTRASRSTRTSPADVRVLARRRRVRRLRVAARLQRPRARPAHVPGPGPRRRGQHRPDAGEVHAGRSTRPRRRRPSAPGRRPRPAGPRARRSPSPRTRPADVRVLARQRGVHRLHHAEGVLEPGAGAHTFRVRAVDQAENVDATPAAQTGRSSRGLRRRDGHAGATRTPGSSKLRGPTRARTRSSRSTRSPGTTRARWSASLPPMPAGCVLTRRRCASTPAPTDGPHAPGARGSPRPGRRTA